MVAPGVVGLIKASLFFFISNDPWNGESIHNNNNYQQEENAQKLRPLNVALIGAGIFATATHAPHLKNSKYFHCSAVFSRNYENAANLATKLGAAPCIDLKQIWNSPNIEGVILAVPVDVQPQLILQAWQAGKHVLSEKPLAENMSKATSLVDTYESKILPSQKPLVWSVAGSFRYKQAVEFTKHAMQDIGNPFFVNLQIRTPFLKPGESTEAMWRNNPQWYGGMIVEAFVHASSMLRSLFGQPLSVVAHTSSRAEHIPSIDTMTAQIAWNENIQGSIGLTFASVTHMFELEVMGDNGRLVLSKRKPDGHPGYTLEVETSSPAQKYVNDIPFGDMEEEMIAFWEAVNQYNIDPTGPREACKDFALVEACLESGKSNGSKVLLNKASMMKTSAREDAFINHPLGPSENTIYSKT